MWTAIRPVLELTEFGEEVMRGKADLIGPLPLEPYLLLKLCGREQERASAADAADRRQSPEASEPDSEVLDALKRWRSKVAGAAGIPPLLRLS